nr:putative retrotransposon Gag domain, aspartic peptidase domain protein [Tanacetum cinerariifolium]
MESLDKRVVGVETSMEGLKTQVEGLKGLDFEFTSEIIKIREEFRKEVSTLHQVIKDLQEDMALYKLSLASGGDNTNHGPKIDVPKPSPFVGKREARAISETIREYVKEFTTLVLEIPELFDQDSLFYFLNGLQGWAKTELKRRRVQDLFTAIAHVEALIDFSIRRESYKPKDQKVNKEKGGGKKNAQPKVKMEVQKVVVKVLQYVEATINGVKVRALVDFDATHNFVVDDKAKRLGINAKKGSGTIKAAMAIKTEKNVASGSMVIEENMGQDDLRQNPKKKGTSKDVVASLDQRVAGVETSMAELKNQVEGLEGLDSDFVSMREDFRVALNTLSGDLKHEIHDLRDSFMGEITKIHEDFREEVSTLHQTIEDFSWESGKLGRLMISCEGWNNTWKASMWWMMLSRSRWRHDT